MKVNKKTTKKTNSVKIYFLLVVSMCIFAGCGKQAGTYHVDKAIIENMAPVVDTGDITISEEMLNAGMFNVGNPARVAAVLEKAAKGESITLGYIGGSITQGFSANPQDANCFAALTTKWWRDTFPNTDIKYVNAGIGGTDSYLGVHRAYSDLIAYNPDLVVVEFSVNDGQNWNQETYESLIREILKSDRNPAVVSLLLTMENNVDYSMKHTQVAFNYKVPILSYKALLDEGYKEGAISWKDVGNADGVHPSNGGHLVIAHMLTSFYAQVLKDINTTEYEEFVVPETTFTKNRYENAKIYYSDNNEFYQGEEPVIKLDGFEATQIPYFMINSNGWVTENGGTMEFTVDAAGIGIVYIKTTDGSGALYDVYVDGTLVASLDSNFPGGWGNAIEYKILGQYDEAGSHTVTLKLNDESAGKKFSVCGIAME